MTCMPFVNVARNTPCSRETSLAAARVVNTYASIEVKTNRQMETAKVAGEFLEVINIVIRQTISARRSSASQKRRRATKVALV
jgi:hypothetical protein